MSGIQYSIDEGSWANCCLRYLRWIPTRSLYPIPTFINRRESKIHSSYLFCWCWSWRPSQNVVFFWSGDHLRESESHRYRVSLLFFTPTVRPRTFRTIVSFSTAAFPSDNRSPHACRVYLLFFTTNEWMNESNESIESKLSDPRDLFISASEQNSPQFQFLTQKLMFLACTKLVLPVEYTSENLVSRTRQKKIRLSRTSPYLLANKSLTRSLQYARFGCEVNSSK